jgi:hypothetical protein
MMSPEELRPEMKRLQDVTDVLMFQTRRLSSVREHNWSKEYLGSIHERGQYLEKCGVYGVVTPLGHPKPSKTCEICYENVNVNNTLAMPCGHVID